MGATQSNINDDFDPKLRYQTVYKPIMIKPHLNGIVTAYNTGEEYAVLDRSCDHHCTKFLTDYLDSKRIEHKIIALEGKMKVQFLNERH